MRDRFIHEQQTTVVCTTRIVMTWSHCGRLNSSVLLYVGVIFESADLWDMSSIKILRCVWMIFNFECLQSTLIWRIRVAICALSFSNCWCYAQIIYLDFVKNIYVLTWSSIDISNSACYISLTNRLLERYDVRVTLNIRDLIVNRFHLTNL